MKRIRMAPLIEVAGLTKGYGRKRGITDVSFEVSEGEVFGFLGPNGAGKTTTMRLLMALLYPNAGSARIAGLDCWRQSVDVKRVVGYLPGELALDPNLTGGQILAYFANLRGGVDRAYLDALISRLDLDSTRRFRQYSHGNKQKVGLIQAFMHRPRLLILDEPTSGLDPLNQHEFDRMVTEVRGDGRTVFLSSHILSEVESVCDRVGIIVAFDDGRSVRVRSLGPHTTIGEMGLITRQLRSATIQAEIDSVLYALSVEAYERLKSENRPLHQALLSYVVTVMTERLSFASKVIGVLRR
jgi:ABC-2 type transport system ATP-binding protein